MGELELDDDEDLEDLEGGAPGGVVTEAVLDYPDGPNPAQARAHQLAADEVLYGGAAGGGKTDWLIAEVLATAVEFPGCDVLVLRRTFPQLTQAGGIERRLLARLPQPQAGTYNAGDHVWTLANGSTITLSYLARDADVAKYLGAEFALIAIDQLEQFTEFQYRFLLHRLRVGAGTKRGKRCLRAMARAGYRPRVIASANPGGVGHGWVKRRFIDPFPLGGVVFRPAPDEEEGLEPRTRCYVPATIDDNLDNVDPSYVATLEALPPDERRALRHGDWNVHKGARFAGFRSTVHVIEPEALPIPLGGTARGVGIDYGLDAPFCALWGARLADDLVVVYRELYQAGLTPKQQALAILAAEAPGERRAGRPVPAALDPSCWARDPNAPPAPQDAITRADGPPRGSIAWRYERAGVPVEKARNDRLAGVAEVADRLLVRPDGFPRLLIYSSCTNLIRTLPELQRDTRRPEDVDTKGEDHAYDALRYLLGLLSRAPIPAAGAGPARAPAKKAAPKKARRRPPRSIAGGVRKAGL